MCIQRRATRMVMEVKTMDHLERLEELDLATLENQTIKGGFNTDI